MASGLYISNAQAHLQAQAINANTTGFGGATLTVYSDAHDKPLNSDTDIGVQEVLVSFILPVAGNNIISPYGVITFGTITSSIATGTGKASWFRIVASNGITIVCDGTIGIASDYCDLTLSNLDIVSGASISLPTHKFTVTKGQGSKWLVEGIDIRTETQGAVFYNAQPGIYYGTGEPPSATGLEDGTLFFKYI
jgi:hypothetical protein